ncbi:MAG: sugar transferase [Candidatus Riflebacteria bacterium]|nr:sugar transferase [Candidatus Riflebacteria bacterium]
MLLSPWHKLPPQMRNDTVKPYYEILVTKKIQLLAKRLFDFFVASLMLVVLSPLLFVIAILIKLYSKGSVFFRQTRVTANGRLFKIFKFRTMCENAEQLGTQVTSHNDIRVTKVGAFLRKYRLDEIPQLINIIIGDMSYVGTRPEVTKYVEHYTPEMYATLLLPAGVTSKCSIEYKDEEKLLTNSSNADETYINEVLPQKMKINLEAIKNFNLFNELLTTINTVLAVLNLDKILLKSKIGETGIQRQTEGAALKVSGDRKIINCPSAGVCYA